MLVLSSRRSRVAIAVVAIVVLVLVLLWPRHRAAARLEVQLTTSSQRLDETGSADLVAVVTERGVALDPETCWYVWTSSNGTVQAEVGRATFRPHGAGPARVTVEAGRIGSKTGVVASIDLAVLPADEERTPDVPERDVAADPPPAEMNGPPPIIDAIEVDKHEVCRGEFVMVSIKAHDPRGTSWDPWLNYQVDGFAGQSYPIFYRGDDKSHNPRFVTVFGKNNQTWVTQEVPEVTVKDCTAQRLARVIYRLVPNTQADFQFRAGIESAPTEPPFGPISYQWDFGDGTTAVTTEPETEHSYLRRKQDAAYSTFVVKARIQNRAGEEVLGRESLTLMNHAFVVRDPDGKHYVELLVELTPRYPERGADGVVRQTAFIWHNDTAPVHITRVQAIDFTDQGDRLDDKEIAPATFLGTAELPASGVKVNVALDQDDQDYILYRTFQIEGTSADGTPVSGSFSLMVPGKVDRSSARVMDPALKERIVTAMKLLGKKPGETVSDEDMLHLEEQGLLPHYEAPPDPTGTGTTTPNEPEPFYFPPAPSR